MINQLRVVEMINQLRVVEMEFSSRDDSESETSDASQQNVAREMGWKGGMGLKRYVNFRI
jgi:hypothetical protein